MQHSTLELTYWKCRAITRSKIKCTHNQNVVPNISKLMCTWPYQNIHWSQRDHYKLQALTDIWEIYTSTQQVPHERPYICATEMRKKVIKSTKSVTGYPFELISLSILPNITLWDQSKTLWRISGAAVADAARGKVLSVDRKTDLQAFRLAKLLGSLVDLQDKHIYRRLGGKWLQGSHYHCSESHISWGKCMQSLWNPSVRVSLWCFLVETTQMHKLKCLLCVL